MQQSSPVKIVEEAYARHARGDLQGVFELLSPEIEISQTTELPWGGTYKGHNGARQFFGILQQHAAAMPQPLRYVPAGDSVAVIGRLTGVTRATSVLLDLDIVHIWTVRKGLVVRFEAYIDTPTMLKALGIPTKASSNQNG
jgi:ketosteroid isomerase-like protein